MKAKPWQKHALANLKAAFGEGIHGPRHRAALLQLPTGLGKSLVAIRLFKALAYRYHGLPLLIVLPRYFRNIPRGWRDALRQELIGRTLEPTWDTMDCPKLPGSRVAFTSHRALLHPSGEWREWLRRRRIFVILDEAHRLGRLKHAAAKAFLDDGTADGLPKWLQRPGRGRPPLGPFFLLVSATPYNPVRFDWLDAMEDTQDSAAIDQYENEAIIDELRLVQGLLGQSDRAHSKLHLVERYCEAVGAALTNSRTPTRRSPLVVTPGLTHQLPPRAPDTHGIRLPSAEIRRSIQQLVDFHRVWHRESVDANRTIVERLLLAGVHCRPGSRNVMGATYGLMTRRALGKISSQTECDIKLTALSKLVRAIRGRQSKVVIFCTHVASARAVTAHLRAELDDNALVHYSTTQSDEAIESFNRPDCNHPAVLVATDRLSESIDLHWDPAAKYLIHFELPWSPLRVLQRFGRLWRIKDRRSVRLPTAPHVFHIVHPGSIEEEVLHRLRRRWSYLDMLGLGSVPCDLGLGQRVPKAPREWGPNISGRTSGRR